MGSSVVDFSGHTKQYELSPMDLSLHEGHGSGKSLPIHCVIETVSSEDRCSQPNVEADSYAIIPGSTPFCEIIKTALVRLGYSSSDAVGAKGTIQVKHWKPLTFDTITDSPDATVEEILGELTSFVTLKIRLSSRLKQVTAEDLKERLLQFLLCQYQTALLSAGCPLEKNTLSQICRGEYSSKITDETRQAFDRWYVENSRSGTTPHPPPNHRFDEPPMCSTPLSQPSHAMFHGYKPRVRTSFDPELEIPRLQTWFRQNQHPSREEMLFYMNELNSLRNGRKPLDLTNIIYWFKNARAALRKAQANRSTDMTSELSNGDLDESQEERLSPATADQVPELPNKNAVYIVTDPMHHPQPTDLSIKSPKNDGSLFTPSPENPSNVFPSFEKLGQEASLAQEKAATPLKESAEQNGSQVPSSPAAQSTSSERTAMLCDEKEEGELDPQALSLKPDSDSQSGLPSSRVSERSSPIGYSPSHQSPLFGSAIQQQLNMNFKPPAGLHSYHPILGSLSAEAIREKLQLSPMSSVKQEMGLSQEELMIRKKRSRVFIDPLTEIPLLEKWFQEDTHPSSFMIEKFCEDLNQREYRQRFPKLEPKNVQLWFKNHRAKVKRMRLDTPLDLHPNHKSMDISSMDLSMKAPELKS